MWLSIKVSSVNLVFTAILFCSIYLPHAIVYLFQGHRSPTKGYVSEHNLINGKTIIQGDVFPGELRPGLRNSKSLA